MEISAVKQHLRERIGNETALPDFAGKLKTITNFYPKHIEKEDKVFFPAARAYFTEAEDQAMLAEFCSLTRRCDPRKLLRCSWAKNC